MLHLHGSSSCSLLVAATLTAAAPAITQVIEDNKQILKSKYDQAKALGVAVNASKARINELRTQIEQWRMQRSAACEYTW
jgi:hypothetical protein